MDANETPTAEHLLSGDVRMPEHVVLRSFDAETVVLNLETGQYHSINPTGARFLDALGEARSFKPALARLEADFADQPGATIERDLREFCLALVERGLLEIVPAGHQDAAGG